MKRIYTIRDNVAEQYVGTLMLHNIDGPAIRDFHTALSTPNTHWERHADNFELHCLGSFDEESGEIIYQPYIVATGKAYAEAQKAAAETEQAPPKIKRA